LTVASCDGGYGDNNVGCFLVGGVSGANVYHYAVYCQTVYHPLAYRFEQVKKPIDLGLQTKQTDANLKVTNCCPSCVQ